MKHTFHQGAVKLPHSAYIILLFILAPSLNFLVGINLDLFAPSLPAIAQHFSISPTIAKHLITINMLGFALSCLFLGVISDSWGRRPIILSGLFVYILASIGAFFSNNIDTLLFYRFIQGAAAASASICSRAILMDSFTGKKLNFALLYTSIAYACGPVFGPFIGGLLQHHFGWRANFTAFTIITSIMFLTVFCFLNESLTQPQKLSIQTTFKSYKAVLSNKLFLFGLMMMSSVTTILLAFPTFGPFVVISTLHQNAMIFGSCALAVGLAYLTGSFINRALLHKFHPKAIITLGFGLYLITLIIQILLHSFIPLSIWTLTPSVILIGLSMSLIYPNIMSASFGLFKENAGLACAVQAFTLLLIGAIALSFIAHFNIQSLLGFCTIYTIIGVILFTAYQTGFKKIFR